MKEIFILIILNNVAHAPPHHVEFQTQAACEAAREIVQQKYIADNRKYQVNSVFCVPKG